MPNPPPLNLKELTHEIEDSYDRILNKFLDEIFELNKDLIDDDHFAKQFNLYLKYDKKKLMNFMQKTGKFPIGADTKCEQNELYVEQAYIMLEKKKFDEAQEILLKRMNSENIQ